MGIPTATPRCARAPERRAIVAYLGANRRHAALGAIVLRSFQFDRNVAGRQMRSTSSIGRRVIGQKSPEPGVGFPGFGSKVCCSS